MTGFTDREMQAKPGDSDQWLTWRFKRGAGVFMGRITPSGERLFYFRYTDSQGRRPFYRLGPYHPKGLGGLTLADAYRKAGDLSTMYLAGVKDLHAHFEQVEADKQQAAELERQHIADEQRRLNEAAQAAAAAQARRLTVRQLFDRWKATLAPMTRADGRRVGRKDGGKYVEEQFTRHVFPALGDRAIDDVRKADFLALLEAQTAQGKARTANVLLSDLKQMLGYAAEHELIPGNLLGTVKKSKIGGPDVARERVLSGDEIRALADALPAARLNSRSQAAVWLILATGVRVGECMGAVWSDALPTEPRKRAARIADLQTLADEDGVKVGIVDVEAATWHLPNTKNQRDHTVHLSAFALDQLGKLAAVREVLNDSMKGELSPWVFPARDNHRPVCVKSFGKQLSDRQRAPERRMQGRSKHTEALALHGGRWTAHDLRRTTGTLMADLGFSADVINECLNHLAADKMTRVYIRSRREEDQRRAFDALGQRLHEVVTGQQVASNIKPLKAA